MGDGRSSMFRESRILLEDILKKQEAETVAKPQVGNKLDAGKPQVSLIPREALTELAVAFTYGANKYAADNFKLGIKFRRLIDAAFRHLIAIADGEDIDSESGNTHVGHAMASLAMLAYMMKNKPELDDRFKKQDEIGKMLNELERR